MIPASIRAVLIAAACAFAQAEQTAPAAEAPAGAVPDFAADSATSWALDQTVDDLLPPPSGAGPITFDPAHPYIANFRGAQPTYRVADLGNPILQPWAREQMRKSDQEVLARQSPVPGARAVLADRRTRLRDLFSGRALKHRGR